MGGGSECLSVHTEPAFAAGGVCAGRGAGRRSEFVRLGFWIGRRSGERRKTGAKEVIVHGAVRDNSRGLWRHLSCKPGNVKLAATGRSSLLPAGLDSGAAENFGEYA